MIYVYSRQVESGREDYCGSYDTWKDALRRITSLYLMDSGSVEEGMFYYFAKER